MQEYNAIQTHLRELYDSQHLAVLATEDRGHPYANLVAFAVGDDLRKFYFATNRGTRKFSNIQSNSQVALLIDNRANSVGDFSHAVAVTVRGDCRELSGMEKVEAACRYVKKHPHLEEFVSSPGCAFMEIVVRSLNLVSRFQNVTEYDFAP